MNPGPFSTNLWHQILRKEESGSKIIRLAESVTERQTFSSRNVKECPNENRTKSAWWMASPFPRQQNSWQVFSTEAWNHAPPPPGMLLCRLLSPDTGCSIHPPYHQPGDGGAALLTEDRRGPVSTGRNESVNTELSRSADVPFWELLTQPQVQTLRKGHVKNVVVFWKRIQNYHVNWHLICPSFL